MKTPTMQLMPTKLSNYVNTIHNTTLLSVLNSFIYAMMRYITNIHDGNYFEVCGVTNTYLSSKLMGEQMWTLSFLYHV